MKKLAVKFGKAAVMSVCVIGLVVMFGCAAFQDLATPIHIEEKAIEYSNVDATSYLPWTTLWDAQRVRKAILYNHELIQLVYQRAQEDDNIEVAYIIEVLDVSIAGAAEFKDTVFNPSGAVGMLLPTLFGGTIGAMFINTGKKKVVA